VFLLSTRAGGLGLTLTAAPRPWPHLLCGSGYGCTGGRPGDTQKEDRGLPATVPWVGILSIPTQGDGWAGACPRIRWFSSTATGTPRSTFRRRCNPSSSHRSTPHSLNLFTCFPSRATRNRQHFGLLCFVIASATQLGPLRKQTGRPAAAGAGAPHRADEGGDRLPPHLQGDRRAHPLAPTALGSPRPPPLVLASRQSSSVPTLFSGSLKNRNPLYSDILNPLCSISCVYLSAGFWFTVVPALPRSRTPGGG